ncbi:MAG: tRNA (adenosine(37)-N6)-dimethylallyltransferase MiaA [Candidatus Omnitrophica bacterium]|nr:tRNA (adenosine(37)-N6)-dimethylallyltransferase MiaA [Candidatus Omnitrophota bacterium]
MSSRKFPEKTIIFIIGPTAIGKSEVAVYLAKKINAEIISCDSMQVYKGMNILTCKPKRYLTKQVKHHLIGVVPLKKEYNVSTFRREAVKRIKKIIKEGRVPLIVGGTGLYVDVLINGIFKNEARDANLRERLYKTVNKKGSNYLYDKLRKLDPAAADKIHPNDIRRIVRALEVFYLTGKPISALQKDREGLKDEYSLKIFCLNMARDKLYKKIDNRIEVMLKRGLIKEVKSILKRHPGKTAFSAIGIKEIGKYLTNECTLKEAVNAIKMNTRRYAKRQLTWFRKIKCVKWVNVNDSDTPFKIATRLWRKLS